jgi:hypothetical protein
MEWYIPISILPGIGLFILSTSNFLIALNNEIQQLNEDKEKHQVIIAKKIQQLKRLNFALLGEYGSALALVVAGILEGITHNETLTIYLVITGVFFFALSISFLIHYSLNSLKIRQEHLNL